MTSSVKYGYARTLHDGPGSPAFVFQGMLPEDIEDSFQDNEKAGVVFLDLTATYDTLWHRGLHLKLLRTIPDWHMVRFIMEMLVNRNFIVYTSDGQTSSLRRLKNGVPQGSILSPVLFNIYIHDLPDTTATKYGYMDDLAIMLRCPTWKALEDGLNRDVGILADYLQKWHLQLSMGKTVAAAYHLNDREARRELDVYVGKNRLAFQQAPKYLGVCLDWTLSYKQHLDEVKAKAGSSQVTGVGHFKSSLKKRDLSDSAACECGELEQTAEHIITGCPLYSPPSEAALFDLGPEMTAWLHGTELAI
ncbi:hypothetical protein MHYP_G00014360 [Metynnis hypsauchen]